MNERIQELAKRHGYLRWDQDSQSYELNGGIDEMYSFAELIVEECMWKIMQRKEEAIDNDWHVGEAMSAALSDISEHFGVE